MMYLITGGAGFIGSNLAEELIRRGEQVRVLDNFSTGKMENLTFPQADRIELIKGDIRNIDDCRAAVRDVDYVLHHAALASVPRSVEDPLLNQWINIEGTLNMLLASRDAGIKRFIFASSSAVYGDPPATGTGTQGPVPQSEAAKPDPLSPYAISKLVGEENCKIFYRLFGLETIALRYFNVFGARQDPSSQYAAVIPKFIEALLLNKRPVIYGDGLQSRDFIFVSDVVQANLRSCTAPREAVGKTYNIACGRSFNLRQLLDELKLISGNNIQPVFADAKPGDIRHSVADVTLAAKILGFKPEVPFREGLRQTVKWYVGEKCGK
ncbi:MAG: SDR family oxidoreductase [Syntrophales bacterium]